jgi:4-diphosphocytidyl-2-C-methyl-D-erythritol kinase
MRFEKTTVVAPAKINWMLRILGRRDDGFHEIETIFQTISLADSLTFSPSDRLELHCEDPSIPLDETNLVWRAADLMCRRFEAPAASIELRKRIPSGGGLGGGSSDAAATISFLARHASRAPSTVELREVALELGSDVPFFLQGGTCYATGRGEELVPLADQMPASLLLVFPGEAVATGEAYATLRRARDAGDLPEREPVGFEQCHDLAVRGLLSDTTLLENDFEDVVFAARPQLASIFERVRSAGAIWTRLSGSGSTIVGAFDSNGRRNRALERLSDSLTVVPAQTTDASGA